MPLSPPKARTAAPGHKWSSLGQGIAKSVRVPISGGQVIGRGSPQLASPVTAANVKGETALSSAAHRSVTVVTVITLIFTPMLRGHHWVNVLTGRTTETYTVQCQSGDPCPKQKH